MRTLAVDSELLVLLIVGAVSPSYILKHKRLHAYSEADFELLKEVISRFTQIVVTPNTLSEASNLLGYINEPIRSEVYHALQAMLGSFEEHYIESGVASQRSEFIRLGLVDSVLLETGGQGHTLLTSDLGLYLAALTLGSEVVNFNHLREARQTI